MSASGPSVPRLTSAELRELRRPDVGVLLFGAGSLVMLIPPVLLVFDRRDRAVSTLVETLATTVGGGLVLGIFAAGVIAQRSSPPGGELPPPGTS